MPLVLESLIPVFLVMLVGWATKATGFIKADQWNGFERVTYHILMPALIIYTLATTDISKVDVLRVGAAMLIPVFVMTAVLLFFRRAMEKALAIDGPAFTSILQGTIRWNAFVGVALSAALYGKEGLALVSVALALVVPAVNLISTIVLSKYGSGKQLDPLGFVLQLIKNPFIWSTLIGSFIAVSGLPVPRMLLVSAEVAGRAALGAGLLLVGSGLEPGSMHRAGPALWLGTSLRLIVFPAMTGWVGIQLGLSGASLLVPVLSAAVPTAAAAYIMARQNGGDAPLMASIMTMQTLGGIATIPLLVVLFS